jgi:hypothetical protein
MKTTPLESYVVTIGRAKLTPLGGKVFGAVQSIGHTIVINAYDRADAKRQARYYINSLTYQLGVPRRAR